MSTWGYRLNEENFLDCVDSHLDVVSIYARWREQFSQAMDPDYFPIEFLDRLMISGHGVMLYEDAAAVIVEIKTFPSGKRVVHGLVAAGDLDGIKRLVALAEHWGRGQGCTAALIESRIGWARVLKDVGYVPFQVAIVKDL